VKAPVSDASLARVSKRIEQFISGYVSKSSAKGLVIGLSGGLDSAVVLKLAVNAIGATKVLGLVMPSDTTPKEDTEDAIDQAKSLGIKYLVIDIDPLLQKYAEILPADKRARGNLMARIRMNILYYYAATNSYLVTGTSDKSELLLGYFTKWGDGAADLLPIADLYKTQTKTLAKFLKIPQTIAEKKSSPRLWDRHLAEEEIGIDYQTIDSILYLIVDKKIKPNRAAKKLGIPTNHVYKIKKMIQAGAHKRRLPPVAHLE
jgi:NAD+ synthase